LVSWVEGGAGTVRVRFMRSVSVVGMMCDPTEWGERGVEGGGLGEKVGEGGG